MIQSWPLVLHVLTTAAENNYEKVVPPEVIPPGKNCSCTWSAWINEDNPNTTSHDVIDDERYSTLRSKGIEICDQPAAIMCWDLYLDTETAEDVYCNISNGLYCNFMCSDYAIRVACCECFPPNIGTPFRLRQDALCVTPNKLESKEKIYLREDCESDQAHWQWGENDVIKNFANDKLCMSVAEEGNGQSIILAACNRASRQQKWSSTFRNGFNIIEKMGTKLNINHRKTSNEIRLHRTTKTTSQFLALPKVDNIDHIITTNKIDMSVLKFKPCEELPIVEHAKWQCSQYNLIYSKCKIKCNPGFKFNGNPVARKICETMDKDTNESDTFWNSDKGDPSGSCEPISCPAIREIENGKIDCSGEGTQSLCTFTCNPGYLLEGKDVTILEQSYEVSCMSSERWSGSVENIKCSPIYCPPLNVDSSISVDCDSQDGSSNGVLVGVGCNLQCAQDNATPQRGLASKITCNLSSDLRTAEWDTLSSQFLVCKLLECPDFQLDTINVTYSSEKFFPETIAVFQCPIGFKIRGESQSKCNLIDDNSAASWTNEQPTCERRTCAEISPPQSGSLECTEDSYYKSTCSIKCPDSFKVSQEAFATSTCQADEKWSNTLSACDQKVCIRLDQSTNIIIECDDNDPIEGSVCRFSCKQGYLLEGDTEISCTNESWSGSIPKCLPVTCPDIQANFPNGIVLCVGTSYGSACSLKCNKYAQLIGPTQIECGPDGEWSASPKCQLITCEVPSELYDEMELEGCKRYKNMIIGQTCQVKCPLGKEAAVKDIKCLRTDMDGENNFQVNLSDIPHCEEISCKARCDGECPIKNGKVVCSGHVYNDKCEYFCDEGFKLFGGSSACEESGWSNEVPECRAAHCDNKPNPTNGVIECEKGHSKRLKCTYKCNPGYLMESADHDPIIQCNTSGSWNNDQVPKCAPKTCPKLSNSRETLRHTKYQCSDSKNLGSTCWIRCKAGYEVNSSEFFRCLVPAGSHDPHWVNDASKLLADIPVCTPKECEPLDLQTVSGFINCTNSFSYKSSCDLICNEGYAKVDPSKAVCSSKNDQMTWDGQLSKCIEVKCTERPLLENGEFKCDGDSYLSTCTGSCRNGFKLINNHKLVCSASGKYTKDFSEETEDTFCQEIKCPSLSKPENGEIVLGRGTETVNSTAELKCDEGYSMFNNFGAQGKIKCGIDGEWENKFQKSEINNTWYGDWNLKHGEYILVATCHEVPLCPELPTDMWSCNNHSENRKRLCKTICNSPRSLWKSVKGNFSPIGGGQPLETTCSKKIWSSSRIEGWEPNQIHCISTCNDFNPDNEKIANGRIECEHNNAITNSEGSSCTILCDMEYKMFKNGELFSDEKIVSTCTSNSKNAEWSKVSANITCQKVVEDDRNGIVLPITKEPSGTGEIAGPKEDNSVVSMIVGILAGLAVIAAIVLFVVRHRLKKKQQNNSPTDYTNMYSTAGGGDELDGLLPSVSKRPMNISRNSRHSNNFPNAAIPEPKLEEEFRKRMQNDQELMENEFSMIPTTTHASNVIASKQANASKNRYRNVLPYDDHRVSLRQQPGDPFSDYINASYIDGYVQMNEFIAAQGPIDSTTTEFWRMIWEHEIGVIIMVTNLKEGAEEKCARYWTEDPNEEYDAQDVTVSLKRMETLAEFVVRELYIRHSITGQERTVQQLHFTAWPDFGVPQNPTGMLKFIRRFDQIRRSFQSSTFGTVNGPLGAPVLVHCSAGVGRTGTFIALDAMLKQLETEKIIDLPRYVNKMRAQRSYMVQTPEQYQFIYAAIVEHILFGNTEFEAEELPNIMEENIRLLPGGVNGFSHQFKKLDQLPNNKDQIRAANHPLNMRKNRLLTILPYDHNRVVLPGKMGVEQSDYINASYIDGYTQQRAYIATQAPLSDTSEDFWRMIVKEECPIIIMLTELIINNEEKCVQYWPETGNEWVSYDNVKVYMSEENESWRQLNVTHRKFHVLKDRGISGEGSHEVDHYQVHGWTSDGCPDDVRSTVELISFLNMYEVEAPVVIHCGSGAGPTGCFIALANTIYRFMFERIIDIFQTAKSLRTQRQHMVSSIAQYTFIFRAVLDWLKQHHNSSPDSYKSTFLSSGNYLDT